MIHVQIVPQNVNKTFHIQFKFYNQLINMKCFGFIPVYMSSIIIAIFNIVFGFSDLIYMIHAYSKLDNLGKRFHLSFFDIQCPSNFLHLWLSQKKGENYIIMDFVRSHHVSGKFTVYSQIYLFEGTQLRTQYLAR